MKLHLNLSLRRALLAAMVAAAALPTARAGVMHDDASFQTYTDFGQNRGRYVVGSKVNALLSHIRTEVDKGITIHYTDDTPTYTISNEQGMISFNGTHDGGHSVVIGPNFIATVEHNGEINGSFSERTVGSAHAINYEAVDIRNSSAFRLVPDWGNAKYDYMLQRQSKVVTDVTWNPLTTLSNDQVEALDGSYLYHSGSGTQYVWNEEAERMESLTGPYVYIIGAINTITDGQIHAGSDNLSLHQQPGYGENGNTGASEVYPLPNGIRPGDSGSPTFIYNSSTGQYEYIAAQQSAGGNSYSQARGNIKWTADTLKSFDATVDMSSTSTVYLGAVSETGETITDGAYSTTLHYGLATDAAGNELGRYNGVQTGTNTWGDLSYLKDKSNWYAYENVDYTFGSPTYGQVISDLKVGDTDLFYTQNLVFTPSQAENNIILNATVDLGIGYAEFNKGEGMDKAVFNISAAEGTGAVFNHAGYVINEGAEVHLKLNNSTSYMTEWRKVGAGDLYIDGTGDTNALLNLGGSGTTYLQQTGGHAAYNVLANSGAKVVIGSVDQIERDFTFGAGGGTLDLNGNSMDWYTSTDADGRFTINALTEEAIITNTAGTATLTYKEAGNTTYAGSFANSATGFLNITYAGGGTWTLNSLHTNLANSTFTVQNGKVILSGTNTIHGMGSVNGKNATRYTNADDWHYADAAMYVEINDGATFELGSHARLRGDVWAKSGSTFILREGVKHQYEYVEGGAAKENTYLYSDFYGLHDSTIMLDSGANLKIQYSAGTTANTTLDATIYGKGSVSVDAGTTGGSLTLSGSNSSMSGTKTLISGGLIATSATALGDTKTNKWVVQEKGWIASTAESGSDLLARVDSSSTGVLALSDDTESQLDLSNYQGLYIGAQQGKTVNYGTAGEAINAVNGAWKLGGGGGTLNVQFLLTGENDLIIGNEYSSGTVHLANTANDFTGSISILGTGNILTYEDGALGNAHVALTYGNSIALHAAKELGILTDGAQGALAATSSMDLNLTGYNVALGAAGDLTFTGTLTVGDKYRLGGIGHLTLDTKLDSTKAMEIDGQGNTGSSVTLAGENAYTGDITAGGGLQLDDAANNGSIGIHAGHENSLAQVNSLQLKKGAVLYTDGNNITVNNLSADTGASLQNNGETASQLRLNVTQSTTTSLADGVLSDSANGSNLTLVKTGTGTLKMGGNSSWSGGLIIEEGCVAVSAASGGTGSRENTILINPSGTLQVTANQVTYDNLGQTLLNQKLTGTGTIEISSGGNMLLTQQAAGFEGTVHVTGNTRLYVGKDLTYNKTNTASFNNAQTFDDATIWIDSGSQVRITNNLVHVSTASVTSDADYIIAGTGKGGVASPGQGETKLVHEDLTTGALSIDCGAVVTGNVELAENATIASWSQNPTSSLYRPTLQNIYGRYYSIDNGVAELNGHYGIKNYLGGTIRGVISGEGKTLTIAGNESMTITADSANTYGELVIANGNGSNDDKFALRLDGGKAMSQTSTALGLGKVTLNDGLILRLAGTGTADNTNVVYTYANAITAGNGATLQSHNITNRLTGTLSMSGSELNLATANGGVLELAGGISGNGTVNLAADARVILGGSSAFGGNISAAAGADLRLSSAAALSATSAITGSGTLNLHLGGTGDFSLGGISVAPAGEDTASTLNLSFDFTGIPDASRADTWSTLSSSISAGSTVIELELNMFNDLRKGEYTLLTQAGSTTNYTLADTMNGRLSLRTNDAGALVLSVGNDKRLFWRSGDDGTWEGTNWYSDDADGKTTFTSDADIMLNAEGVATGNSATSRETISLGSNQTTGSIAAQQAAYEITGSGSLSGTSLTVGNKGDLKLSNTGGNTFTAGVLVNDAALEVSSNMTADITAENGGSYTHTGGTLTGNISLNDASATIRNATLAGNVTTFGTGTLSLNKAKISGTRSFSFDAGNLTTSQNVTLSGTFTYSPGQTVLQGSNMSVEYGTLTTTAALDVDTLNITGGSFALNHTAGTTTEIDVITGNGSLKKNSAGNLNLINAQLWGLELKGGGTTIISGTVNITNDPLSVGKETLNLDNGANVTVTRLTAGDTAKNQNSQINIGAGASLTITGSNDTDTTSHSLLLAHWGNSASSLKLQGGTLTANNTCMLMGWDSGGTFEALSGTANLKGIRFSSERSNADTLKLGSASEGSARLNLGAGGITGIGTNDTVELGNGTISATADFAISGHKEVNLIGTNSGTTFDAAGHTITVNTALAGDGNLIKSGSGTLLLAGDGTGFSGNITVEKGSLAITTGGKSMLESASNVHISSGTLDMSRLNLNSADGAIQISSGQTFTLSDDAAINLGNIQTDTEYLIFNFNGGYVDGWDELTADDIIIGGVRLSDMGRTQYSLNMNGSFSYKLLENRVIVWNGGDSATRWTQAVNDVTWVDESNANTSFVNFDNVTFQSDADLTLDGEIHVDALTIAEGVSLKTTGQLTVHGAMTLGNGFSWDFSGNTTLSFTEASLKAADSIVVGEGATLIMTNMTTGQNQTSSAFNNVTGTGNIVLNLANNNGVGFNMSGFSGDVTVATGRLQVNTSIFNENTTIHLATSDSQLVFNNTCELKNDVVLEADTTFHVNTPGEGLYTGTISGDILGEDKKLKKAGGSTLVLKGRTTLKALETYAGQVIIDSPYALIETVDGAMSDTAGGTLKLEEGTSLRVTGDVWSRNNTGILLEKGSELALLRHNICIINERGEDTSLKATTSNGKQYSLAESNYEIRNARVVFTGSESATLGNKLTNVTLENSISNAVAPAIQEDGTDDTFFAGSTLTVTNAENTLNGVIAYGGDVTLQNLQAGTSLNLLEIAAGRTVSAYVGANEDEKSAMTVTDSTLLCGTATLNTSLTLAEGSTLDMTTLGAGAVTLNGALTFGGKVTMGANLLAIVNEMSGWDESITLFTGLSDVTLPSEADAASDGKVLASEVFTNVNNTQLYVTYQVIDNVGSLLVVHVPEPTTATLSLLALAALAARRRRKE